MFGGEKLTVSQFNNNNNIGEKQCQPSNPKNLKKSRKSFPQSFPLIETFQLSYPPSYSQANKFSTGNPKLSTVGPSFPQVIHRFSTTYPLIRLRRCGFPTMPQSFPQYPNSPPWSYPQPLWITYQKTVLFKKAKKKRAKFSAYGVVPTAQCHRFSTAPIETLQKMKRFKKFSTKVFHRWITS